nr:GGDEF domain-containing protein [Treponema sp.]
MERDSSNKGQNLDSVPFVGLENYNRLDTLIEQYSVPLNILSALANSYHTMHLIDLRSDTAVEINSTLDVRRFQNPNLDASQQIKQVFNNVILASQRERVLDFMNLKTLPCRLKGKKSISVEYTGLFSGWVRATFVPMSTDEDGNPTSVILYSRVIEDEKRREERLIKKSTTDELTGLFNRHAYEDALRSFADTPENQDLVFVSMDVNGLKVTNDKFGHVAGDKLLKGAAACMRRTIGKYGNIYRTGGDEFVAIIKIEIDKLEGLKAEFNETCKRWAEKRDKKLSISSGYITRAHHPDLSLQELIKYADQRMYSDKARYYSSEGYDRRSQQQAFFSISKSYTKIIKVNLMDETQEIIHMDYKEEVLDGSMCDKISDWWKKFVQNGYIHKDDIGIFESIANIDMIRKHFAESDSIIRARYRRRYEDGYKYVN